jgi:hypothetical protein
MPRAFFVASVSTHAYTNLFGRWCRRRSLSRARRLLRAILDACDERFESTGPANYSTPGTSSRQRRPAPPYLTSRARRSTNIVPKMLSHATALPVGRQVVHTEPWTKVMLVMLDRHVAYLDVVSVLIRLRHHRAMSRAEILRGLIEFMERSRIDFSRFATAAEMTEHLATHFRQVPGRGRVPLLLESSLLHPVRRTDGAIRQRARGEVIVEPEAFKMGKS